MGSPEQSEKYAGLAWPSPAIRHCWEKAQGAWFSLRITIRGKRQPPKLTMQGVFQGVPFNRKQIFLLFQGMGRITALWR